MWKNYIDRILSIIPKKKPRVEYAITPEYAELLQYPLYRLRPPSRLQRGLSIIGKIWGRVNTGITNIADAFNSKYPTMQIFSEAGTWDVIPLRKISSGLIFVKVRGKVYPFVLDASKMKTYRYKGGKVIQTILYDIEDAYPIDPATLRRLREYADKNNVTNWTEQGVIAVQMAYDYLHNDPEHTEVYIEDLCKSNFESPNMELEIKTMIENVGAKSLVKPTPQLAEVFDRKINLDPKMMAQGIMELKNELFEYRKIANPAKTPFKGWIMIFALIGIFGAIAVGGWYADQEGLLSGDNDLLGGNVEDIDWESLQNLGSPQELLGGFELDPLDIIPENQTVLLQPDDEP